MFSDLYDLPDNLLKEFYSTKNNTSEKFVCSTMIGYCGRVYRIYIKTELDDKSEVGFTDYQQAKIYLKFLDMNIVTKTLIHELTHAWMFENGHNQSERTFNHEDVCEICACSYEFIYDTLKQFYENLFNSCIKDKQVCKHGKLEE